MHFPNPSCNTQKALSDETQIYQQNPNEEKQQEDRHLSQDLKVLSSPTDQTERGEDFHIFWPATEIVISLISVLLLHILNK